MYTGERMENTNLVGSEFQAAHHALLERARQMPDRLFLSQPVDGGLRDRSWKQVADEARRMASALSGIGLEPGDKVAILAKNSAEWVIADVAIAMAGMISVPVYPTAGADTIAYVLGHSEASAVFVGKLDDPATAIAAVPDSLPSIAFPYDIDGCDYRWDSLVGRYEPIETVSDPLQEDVMTILYTSGSTGTPKGVVLSFGAYCYASRETAVAMELTPEDRFFSYLPLAHITERTCCAGPAIYIGTSMAYTESLETFTTDLRRARPTIFLSVPRLWVKFQSGVHAKIPPARLKLLLSIPILRSVIARKIREQLGFGSCDRFGSGAAPISPSTLEWFHKLGIEISEGWGMSETSGLATANSPFDPDRIGTIGVPLHGTEVRLSDEGEILLRSPGLFSGYYKNQELSREVFTDDGFFRTGDKAEWIEATGAYKITGRVKDIFKSAKGKYVMPVPIESRLSANPLFEQLCVMGSGQPAPVVVIVLSEAALHLPASDVESRIEATLAEVNQSLESHERLARAFVASEEWTAGNGLLTPTLKLKRNVLEDRYRELISGADDALVVWERP